MPDPQLNQQEKIDAEHLKLLSIFHYIMSGMAALFACIPIIHLVIGLVILLPGMASCFVLAGWTLAVLILLAGRFIARRKHYTFCFVMACVECMFMPFGTVLGAFTLLVLTRLSVKELFTPRPTA